MHESFLSIFNSAIKSLLVKVSLSRCHLSMEGYTWDIRFIIENVPNYIK